MKDPLAPDILVILKYIYSIWDIQSVHVNKSHILQPDTMCFLLTMFWFDQIYQGELTDMPGH